MPITALCDAKQTQHVFSFSGQMTSRIVNAFKRVRSCEDKLANNISNKYPQPATGPATFDIAMINREILKQCSALSTLTPLIDYINNLKSPINLEVIEYLNAERNLQDKEEKHNFLRTLTTDLYKLSQLPAVDTFHRQLAHKVLTTPICGLAFQQYGNIDQPALSAIFADTANHQLITDEMLALLDGLQQNWTLGGDSGQ